MSTRACIARSTGPDTFTGRYQHWDGYPSGLGRTLYELRRDVFAGDTAAMLATLIDNHPGGWSSIGGSDWSLPVGRVNSSDLLCRTCLRPDWAHWIQHYQTRGHPTPEPFTAGQYCAFDHTADVAPARNAACYCHEITADGRAVPCSAPLEDRATTNLDAASCGVEWVYAFTADGCYMHVLASECQNGKKMIGMFGMGDPAASWRTVATVDLRAPAPDWEGITA